MKGRSLADSVDVMTLTGFALAQPLYELLGRHSAFFVFHHCQPGDILLFVAVLSLLLPLALAGLFLLLPGRRWTHPALVAMLTALILGPVLSRFRALSPGAIVSLALLGGGALAWLRLHCRPVRWFFTALAPALVVFPVLFLIRPDVAKLLRPEAEAPVHPVEPKRSVPVVLVVFDEFPLISLLNEKHEIDEARYPHFASLARNAHWFRQATAVHPWTIHAIPALLSGRRTQPGQSPRWQDHPNNLFTLLGRSHELNVHEYTSLCPEPLNTRRKKPGFTERLGLLFSDLLLVQAHLLLPEQWAARLPSVDTDWANFGETKQSFLDRPAQYHEFLDSLKSSEDRPGLHFLHIVLPHTPFSFLPSGKGYGRDAFVVGLNRNKTWTREENVVAHAHQRHLLQAGYVDRCLGELIARLKETGLYEQCLLIVTADHGCSFLPGEPYRRITPQTASDVLRVPLFIKAPGQNVGKASDRNVEHTDILPTIAAVLGVEVPWEVEGQSALDESRPERPRKLLLENGEPHEFGPRLDGDWGSLPRQLSLFGSGSWERVHRHGPSPSLVGKRISTRTEGGTSSVVARIHDGAAFQQVTLRSTFIPARVQGTVQLVGGEGRPLPLAVSVNGIVQATTQVRARPDAESVWAVMVPEAAFKDGANLVELHEITPAGELRRLTGTEASAGSGRWELQGDHLLDDQGRRIRLRKHAYEGYLDIFHVDQACVTFAGWGADPRGGRLPERIVVLADGKFFHAGPLSAERLDVMKEYQSPVYRWCGFNFCLPRERFQGLESAEFRFFAIGGDGEGSELRYQEWYNRRGRRPLQGGRN